MHPHHRTAIALRVVRASGGRVRVTPRGSALHVHVSSPCEAAAVRELSAAGFTALGAFVHPAGWQHTLLIPRSPRMTAALLSLDGTGPLSDAGATALRVAGVGTGDADAQGACDTPTPAEGDAPDDDAPADGAAASGLAS